MGSIKCVCISRERKASAYNVHRCAVDRNGIAGDIHYGFDKKQVSLLPYSEIKKYFEEMGEPVVYGRFGENLVAEGIDWEAIRPGSRIRCGQVLLEVVKIGAGGPASDAYKGEKVCTPMEPYFIFCKVLQEGILEEEAACCLQSK